jgi:hypothetical protein
MSTCFILADLQLQFAIQKKNRTNIKANTYEIADALSFNANFRRQNVIADFEGDRINLNSVRE